MANVTIRMLPPHNKVGSVKAHRLAKGFKRNRKIGLTEAGAIIQKRWFRNISGTGYTKNPGRSKPFPGHLTGEYARTLRAVLFDRNRAVRIGPDVKYAIYHETGTRYMPARPVVEPTLKAVGKKAVRQLRKRILKPLKRRV